MGCIGVLLALFACYIRTNDKAKQLPDKAIDCIYKYLDEHSK